MLVAIVIAFCVFVIAPIAIGIGGDIYDLNHRLWWISFAKRIQWESILAGALGLLAGLFVIYSTQVQIAAAKENAANTLQQAKLHRADQINAPLQLALDVSAEVQEWCSKKIELLETNRALFDEFRPATEENLQQLLDRTYRDLLRRCQVVQNINDAHNTTTFNYAVNNALKELSDSYDFYTEGEQTQPEYAVLYNYNIIRDKLIEGRSRSVIASNHIREQMKVIKARCGLED